MIRKISWISSRENPWNLSFFESWSPFESCQSKFKFESDLTAVQSLFYTWAQCSSPFIKKFSIIDHFPGPLVRTNIFKFKEIWDSIVIIILIMSIGSPITIVVRAYVILDFLSAIFFIGWDSINFIVRNGFLAIWFIKKFNERIK